MNWQMKPLSLYGAWAISCIGTLGSLVASELYGFAPCHLCWYQRIALFPLAWILGVAAYDLNFKICRYVRGLPVFGALVAAYQIFLNTSSTTYGCASGCSLSYHGGFLFWMPILSFASFIAIIVLLTQASKQID